MPRLRYTRAEAEAEATRRATALIARTPGLSSCRCIRALPDPFAPAGHASKHPVAWVVLFAAPLPPGHVIDGGELFVNVNLETGVVTFRE